jgi:hypothetical protein
MPNWCSNKITVYGSPEELEEFMAKVGHPDKAGEGLDFEKIIPMPESLKIESGSYSDLALAYYTYINTGDKRYVVNISNYGWVKEQNFTTNDEVMEFAISRFSGGKTKEEVLADGEKIYLNMFLYGAKSWYDWSVREWGTKWNVSDTDWEVFDDHIVMFFSTAWSPPAPIYMKLAKLFPGLSFDAQYAEGGNCFVGEVTKLVGDTEVSFTSLDWEDGEGREIATDLGQYYEEDEEEDIEEEEEDV